MINPPRFTTVRVGMVTLTVGTRIVESDLRIVVDSEGNYRLLDGTLSEPLPTIEKAMVHAGSSEVTPSNVTRHITWREDTTSVRPGEHPCPICGMPTSIRPGYPRSLCSACVLEATSLSGRLLQFKNVSLSGG